MAVRINFLSYTFDERTVESAVVFANAKGDMILIGISNKGIVTGVDIGKETLAKWANQVSHKTKASYILIVYIFPKSNSDDKNH